MSDTREQLRVASACLQRSDTKGCRRVCDALLKRQPDLMEARHLRGLAAATAGDTLAAVDDLTAVHDAQPDNGHAAFWLGRLLRLSGRLETCLEPLECAAARPGLEVDARYELGRALTRLRRGQEAEQQYRRILQLNPEHVDAAANLAFALERRNRLEEAGHWARHAERLQPGGFMASLTLATLERRQGEAAAARRRLVPLAESADNPLNRSIALSQIGQCLDQMGEWEAAFEEFRKSNALLRSAHPLGRPAEDGPYGMHTLEQIHCWLVTHPPKNWTENPLAQASDPVFLVGFPRSGTTLLDQVLSAHPEVEVCEEFELFDAVRRNWTDGGRFRSIGSMTRDDLAAARQTYLVALASRRRLPDRPVVIDKLPLNLAYLFLVHRLFPASPVIFATRDPRDACLSCFFQSFDLQGAMPYFLDLDDTARYYDQVMRLAVATIGQIGNPLLRVRYEELVTNFEPVARTLIRFLGCMWHASVLDYRSRALERLIDTPSYHQVVQPLYATSVGRWRRYRRFMEPLSAILGPWVERLGYPES